MSSSTCVVACIKWVQPNSSGDSIPDERFAGISLADQAALELALRTGDATGSGVIVITVGPVGSEKILREALASGATRAIRIDASADAATSDCAIIASDAVKSLGDISVIWCGDYSPDRGSGSFPAFLAAHLELDQALGLVSVEFPATGSFPLNVVRRLDGGRRERAVIRSTVVLSVEGSIAKLRRASLSRMLASQSMPIEVIESDLLHGEAPTLRPYRPRTRTVPPPQGSTPLDRIRSVTEASTPKGSSEPVELAPARAAALIIQRLREWGHLR